MVLKSISTSGMTPKLGVLIINELYTPQMSIVDICLGVGQSRGQNPSGDEIIAVKVKQLNLAPSPMQSSTDNPDTDPLLNPPATPAVADKFLLTILTSLSESERTAIVASPWGWIIVLTSF